MVGFEETKILRIYDSVHRQVFRTSYYKIGEETRIPVMHYDEPLTAEETEDEEIHQSFVIRSDSHMVIKIKIKTAYSAADEDSPTYIAAMKFSNAAN